MFNQKFFYPSRSVCGAAHLLSLMCSPCSHPIESVARYATAPVLRIPQNRARPRLRKGLWGEQKKSGNENPDSFRQEIPSLRTYRDTKLQPRRSSLFFSCAGKWRRWQKSYSKLLGQRVGCEGQTPPDAPPQYVSWVPFPRRGHSLQPCEQCGTLERHYAPTPWFMAKICTKLSRNSKLRRK